MTTLKKIAMQSNDKIPSLKLQSVVIENWNAICVDGKGQTSIKFIFRVQFHFLFRRHA